MSGGAPNLGALLERAAHLHPREIAVVDGSRRLDYATVHARALALASGLRALGVRDGDRVAILAWNGLEFLEAYFAAAWCGAILQPLNVRLAAVEQAEVLRDSQARVLLADASFAPAVGAVLAAGTAVGSTVWIGAQEHTTPVAGAPLRSTVRIDANEHAHGYDELVAAHLGRRCERTMRSGDDVAQLYYTSGTTGRPKGVMLTHRNVWAHALGTLAELGIGERDAWAHVAPMFHLADAWATFAVTWAGGRHVMLPRFECATALDLLESERVTITNLIPVMLNQMVKHESARSRDWSAFRLVLSGGQPIAPEVVRAIVEVFGCEYVQTYGMTETSPYLTLSRLKARFDGWSEDERMRVRAKTGRPFATVELRVVGDDGREVAPDERAVGEIRVRGETVTPGYWNQPEATAAAFEDGWLKTGDLAVVDAEGYVTIVDRKKDMINTGGEKVYTTEVEHALYAHPAVLEAAVYGVPDATWGESVRAAVVLRPGVGASAEELAAFCKTRLAAYKVPRAFDVLDALPRTGSGKIAKRLLRDALDLRAGR